MRKRETSLATGLEPEKLVPSSAFRKSRLVGVVVAATLLLAACAGGEASEDVSADETSDEATTEETTSVEKEVISLAYGIHLTENGMNSVQFRDYIERVNAAMENYEIELEGFYSGSLCTVQEQLQCVTDGRLDITMAMSVFAPTEMPITTMTEIPFLTWKEEAAALALRDLYEENEEYRQEFENLDQKVLFFSLLPPNVHGFTRPVETLEDLRGMNYRTLGYVANAFSAVGANPQSIPTAEVFESLERGVVEGFMGGFDFAANAGFQELTPYWYDMVGVTVTAPMTINLTKWNSLPPEVQDAMTAEADASYENFWEDFAKPAYSALCEVLDESLEYLGPFAENDEFAAIGLPAVEAVWLEAQEGVISDPEGMLTWYKDRVAQYEAEIDTPTPFELCTSITG